METKFFPWLLIFFPCRMENCGITAAGCGDLSTLLSAMPTLTELCIGENKIGDAGVAVLCQGLLNPNCKIEKLW